MKLVSDARDALRWHSTQAFAALALLPLVWAELPDDLKSMVPDEYRPWIIAALAVAGLIGRLRAQE